MATRTGLFRIVNRVLQEGLFWDDPPAWQEAAAWQKLVESALQEHEYREMLRSPIDVNAGAVWKDNTGKLTGDLITSSGPISFSDATIGESIPPDPQLDMDFPPCGEDLRAVGGRLASLAEEHDTQAALSEAQAIRNQLAEYLQLAERSIARLTWRTALLRAPAHTAKTLTAEQMAAELDRMSRPASDKHVPLKHAPDYNQAF